MDSGSAIPSTSRDYFYQLPVVLPEISVLHAFGRLVEPLFMKVEANDTESNTLRLS